MIPANVDHIQILADLNIWGLRDYKIEAICGFSIGYVSYLKGNPDTRMSYDRAARLYNFWWDEQKARDSRGTEQTHNAAQTEP